MIGKIIPKAYRNWKMLGILILGFASGLPLALIGSTLSVWLIEEGINKSSIGLLSLCGLFYSFKFVWSPFMDSFILPILGKFGKRVGWIIFTQITLIFSIIMLGLSDPSHNMNYTVLFACIVAFCSSSHDIVVDAFRIESLDDNEQAAGSSLAVLGYRLGMLFSSSGALFLSEKFTWSEVYFLAALGILIGTITVLIMKEPKKTIQNSKLQVGSSYLTQVIIEPFTDFTKKRNWFLVLLFILSFKLGESFLNSMLNPFFLELGFTKKEIATIVKTFGFFATISGSIIGGTILYKFSTINALWITGILQMASNLIFILQANAGHDIKFLIMSILTENITGGMATAVMIGYISSLCNLKYTATQFALFSSLSAVGRTIFSASSGFIANYLGWKYYFIFTSIVCLPALSIIAFLKNPEKKI